MTIGERIEARRKALGIASQAELARLATMKQSTLNGLVRNGYRWSPHLPSIARVLRTSVDYLVGDTDDPETSAATSPISAQDEQLIGLIGRLNPAERRAIALISTSLAAARANPPAWRLPNEDALAAMFEGMLDGLEANLSPAERARQLAQRLPIGLSQLRDVMPAEPPLPPAPAGSAGPRARRAKADPELQR